MKYKDPSDKFSPIDVDEFWKEQKECLCTSPDRMFGYMWYLIRIRLGFNQTIMANSFFSNYKNKYKNGLSKSAYSKVENGQTSINFDLIFIYSQKYGIDFNKIYGLYSYLLELAYNNNCYYLEPCGSFVFGKNYGYVLKNGVSTNSVYTSLKDYYKYFRKVDLEVVYKYIDQEFLTAKNSINYELIAREASS